MKLSALNLADAGETAMVSGPYHYLSVTLEESGVFEHDGLDAYAVFCLSCAAADGARIDGDPGVMSQGWSVTAENSVRITAVGGPVTLLVAGATRATPRGNSIRVTAPTAHYRVTKPWGHELWINGEDPDFCFKEIFIKAGNRTSLQYHHLKQETNLLVSGTADIVYNSNAEAALDEVREEDLGARRIDPVTAVDVTPRVLHRISAVSDVLLYEVSTPHLDDVIRIHDDALRENGRIPAEHTQVG